MTVIIGPGGIAMDHDNDRTRPLIQIMKTMPINGGKVGRKRIFWKMLWIQGSLSNGRRIRGKRFCPAVFC